MSFRRRMMMVVVQGGYPPDTIMTIESNPEVLAICYAQGWCANANYMTASEAAVVTSILTVFREKTTITHFDEFRYFTGLTAIGIQVFQDCQNLVSIELPSTITTIGKYAFYRCYALQKIVISSSVTSIGIGAFQQCTSLATIKSLATSAPTVDSSSFRSINTGGVLQVPSGASGYDVWMGTGNYYLGKYNWTKVEQ